MRVGVFFLNTVYVLISKSVCRNAAFLYITVQLFHLKSESVHTKLIIILLMD